ncbi:MAG: Preprotein translocase, SecE subunit [Parcubacteria group bacterium GW2011_GWB1_46_8]|nr:MAG: Preprotein translocase, SecE subunit [Parcubacteria group bacterium GW2011_GWF1_45_5]KKU10439.1 MAG: Preprotein translocase, SecE subunit [Parcubacteria group bacterium GW2011_GWA1_45_7]KKU46484.1 MAG: Preprotein translocase, SecE subunit [Parcubacteria group bacterium GW2011_GWB1_46_8]KKU47041.1 MAG: Preprotein translocase, SecE subunit [Parcubacteria group bacterium GW2011_GWF2_46_8]
MNVFNRIKIYLNETRIELKKVSWPTRKEVIRYVIGVIVFSGIVAFILGAFDFGFLELVRALFV